ncbi:uncharacterized protein LOC126981284 [Eriocheir sinensis]|uniref:uncharacterized protein LOC126981284 n=1 Tax=Eriocheir sinensis TaxID=95602 RepID=UPI0021C86D21|nr:uncharacterized protein LOC126981284 [Eriocheir sinensis]XP_050688143.1 uncharacterized protein LOC126981284 [Eriocheir sinensis]
MDHAGVKAALARVMSRNSWLPALIQENDDTITRDTIMEQVEARAVSLGVAPALVAKDMLLSRLKTLAQEVVKGHNRCRELELLADTMGHLVERKILAGTEVEENLLQEPLLLSLPLTAIWRMSRARVISLEQVIKSMYEDNLGKKALLVGELLDLLLHQRGSSSTQAASDVLALLVDLVYNGSGSIGQEWQPLAKFAGEVLQALTEGVLDAVLTSKTRHPPHKQETEKGTCKQVAEDHQKSFSEKHKKQKLDDENEASVDSCEAPNMYQLVLENPRVPQEALEGFFSAQLVQTLTHRPNIKLTRVLKEQEAWCSAKANPTLVALMQKLLVGLGHEEALNVLELVLSNEEVNWGCVLTLVATALTCHRATAARLKELIERNIRRGCEELEVEPMVVGFLFARHAGQEGRHLFPSYAQWFSSLFSPEKISPAVQKQSFVFLIRFLTDMVPHEPAHCLRAHLNSQIFTPNGCREILLSYNHLARARLQELKEKLQDNLQAPSSRAKGVEEVEAAVRQFSETGKIPSFVLQASIFQETYFRSFFIPALLAPRHLPEVPDAQAKLIDALHARGKISQTLMRNYTEACQKQAVDLLQGVFMDVEEEEMQLEEPITELKHLLEELVATHHKHPAGDSSLIASEVLPVLSKVSLKMEEMMKGFDAQLKNARHLIFDRRLYDEKLLPSQIVDHIINTLARLLPSPATEENEVEEEKPQFLTQLLSLLSTSGTLQRSLLLLFFHHFSLENLTQEQLRTNGIVLCELSKIEGLFLPVVEATQPNQAPTPLTAYYLRNLPLDTPAALHNVCCILSSWLKWHIMYEGAATSLPKEPLHLYLCLAPRLPLMLNHSEDNEVTTADVYNYMEGIDVPECSRLFYSDDLKGQSYKIPLETWLEFELGATWGDVPVEVRQTFLYSRLLGNVSLTQHFISSTPESHPPLLDRLVAAFVSSFAVLGLKRRNSSELLLLLQNAGQQCKNVGFCLLEAWYLGFKGGTIDSRSTLSYISICRCLSASLFLRGDNLLKLAELMQTLVNVLMSVTDMIQLSLCDTTFLCTSLLSAAAEPNIKNLHIALCLKPIKPAVVFHWDSLRTFFGSHIATIGKHECLKVLWITLSQESPDLLLLGSEEAGVRLLSITLSYSKATCNKAKDIIMSFCGKTSYLKWLLAYLGLRQVKGNIPYLFEEDLKVTELDERVMLWSFRELMKLLGSKTVTEVTGDIFPGKEETCLGFMLVPVACIFVVLCGKEGHFSTEMHDNSCEAKVLEILLLCSNLICQTFDNQNNGEDRQPDSKPSRKSLLSSKRWQPDLDYLSHMHQKLILYLSTTSPSVLAKITKNTIMNCDSEVRATIYSRVASKRT